MFFILIFQRKQTERFGKTDPNRDYWFGSSSDSDASPDSDGKFELEKDVDKPFNANVPITPNGSKQICRIEAKLDNVLKTLQQMRISVMSSIGAGAAAQIEKITELPVTSPSALDFLESELNTPAYRKKIVSFNDTDGTFVCLLKLFIRLFSLIVSAQHKTKYAFIL